MPRSAWTGRPARHEGRKYAQNVMRPTKGRKIRQ
jgi:hypothetical protein